MSEKRAWQRRYNAPASSECHASLHPALLSVHRGNRLFTAWRTYRTAQTQRLKEQMYGNQNNLCVRLGSFTTLQKSYAPDVCFSDSVAMPDFMRSVRRCQGQTEAIYWTSLQGRAGHSPSMAILLLYLATIGFSSQYACDLHPLNMSRAVIVSS